MEPFKTEDGLGRAADPDSTPKARNPLLALVLSFPAPGLGHLYLGDARTAFAIAAVFVLLAPLSVIVWSLARFDVRILQILLLASGPLAVLAIAVWAGLLARRRPAVALKRWQRPLGYVTFFMVVTMTGFIASNYVQANFARQVDVQSDALAPAVRSGDTVWLVRTRESKLPRVGAAALYAPTEALKAPIFVRLVAVHPDKVAVKDGAVFVNGARTHDAPGAKELPEAELTAAQAFGIADGRDPSKNVLDSRDVGPLRTGDYLGSVAVIAMRRPDPKSSQRTYLNEWLVPR